MGHELTPEQIADICIGAGFNDYEPHIYDTIRIRKAIVRAIEAERAQAQQLQGYSYTLPMAGVRSKQ